MANDFFNLTNQATNLDEAHFVKLLLEISAENENTETEVKNIVYTPSHWPNSVNRIENTIFKNCGFSKTRISEVTFRGVTFLDCMFIDTDIIGCEFHDCIFINCNTYKFSISGSYIDPRSFDKATPKNNYQNIGVGLYQKLTDNARNSTQPDHYSDALFLFKKWQRKQALYDIKRYQKKNPKRSQKAMIEFVTRWVYEKIVGSGIRIRYYIRTIFIGIISITIVNWAFSTHISADISGPIDAFYFTVISLTTVGYGDITPTTSAGKIWAAVQGILGLVGFAILASLGFRKISPL